ncbi:uncharacterized protein TNCV_4903931 [Trichonephila clavipes]|nr:uncharacterized protein TNCV_4903931 [Trichonephila clavipes]
MCSSIIPFIAVSTPGCNLAIMLKYHSCGTANRPFDVVVSDADFYALGLGSNPIEDMDVCKCIVHSRHGVTLNSRRASSPLVRLVEGKERWEAPVQPQGILPQNWDETEINHSVTCMVLKATANDRCHFAICMMNSIAWMGPLTISSH